MMGGREARGIKLVTTRMDVVCTKLQHDKRTGCAFARHQCVRRLQAGTPRITWLDVSKANPLIQLRGKST